MEPKFEKHLKKQGLLPSTRQKYDEIIESAQADDLVRWIEQKVHARTPIGTVLPMRAAVKHYLISVLGYDEDDVKELLPKAKGRANKMRHALTPTQLALYHAAVGQIDQEPAHTILSLLPSTGLRIGEITALRLSEVHASNGRHYLQFRGKRDKERVVPLTRAGANILADYITRARPKDFLFTGYSDAPIGPHAIRKYTRWIAAKWPDLSGLTPHILRHTWATMALRKGVDLKTLQVLLGHENIATTQRYLHPDREMLAEAVDLLEEDDD